MLYLVRELTNLKQPTLLFTATRHHVEFLYAFMAHEGIGAAMVHGSMDQVRRAGVVGGSVCGARHGSLR